MNKRDCKYAEDIVEKWDHGYGYASFEDGVLTLATGGWSDNEEIVLELDPIFVALYWQKSERGGLHVYDLGKTTEKAEEAEGGV